MEEVAHMDTEKHGRAGNRVECWKEGWEMKHPWVHGGMEERATEKRSAGRSVDGGNIHEDREAWKSGQPTRGVMEGTVGRGSTHGGTEACKRRQQSSKGGDWKEKCRRKHTWRQGSMQEQATE